MKKVISLVLGASLLLGGCGTKENTVVVASKPHTEEYLLANMITLLIEDRTDLKVDQKLGIAGGTANIHPAMLNGEIDIYPEYTGTGWLYVLKNAPLADADALFDQLSSAYLEQFGIKWFEPYGFNNTFAIAVTQEVATKYNLSKVSDLRAVSSDMVFGAEPDFFEREDGFNGLIKAYGMSFASTKDMDIGLKYEGLVNNEVDVIDAFSTDSLLNQYAIKVLEDDLQYFPTYYAATLARQEVLDKFPELVEVLPLMSGLIDDQTMIELNYAVDVDKKDAMDVAKAFLIEKGLLDE
ncbi:MAG: glycine betaine ABC transporter substrate-binding protein [Erysipelotrichaceae bacterium]